MCSHAKVNLKAKQEFKESQSMFNLQQHGWCPFFNPKPFYLVNVRMVLSMCDLELSFVGCVFCIPYHCIPP